MPRYKLSVPQTGDMLHGEVDAAVADTIDEARVIFEDYDGEPCIYLHSHIGLCRVVYARDVDNGDCHDDAEPGDTTIDHEPDDGRELATHEIRYWERGAPSIDWRMTPSPAPIPWRKIPVGMTARHAVWGEGKVCAPPRPWRGYAPLIPVLFADGRRAGLLLGQIALYYGVTVNDPCRPPATRYELSVAGEVVATGVHERTAEILRDMRIARLTAEWEAEQYAAYERRFEVVEG